MGSFNEVQEMMLLSSEEKIIDDEEFPLLYEAYMPQKIHGHFLSRRMNIFLLQTELC